MASWPKFLAMPIALAALAPGISDAPLLNPIDAEIWLLVSLPLFIWFGLRLRAFADVQENGQADSSA